MNTGNEVLQIPLSDITPNQFQPRMNFDEKELEELSQSIKEHGIIQPLVLRKMGDKYEIIAGERRYRASKMLGMETVPAIISNIDDQASAEVALVENVQRKDLSAIEEARSYKNLLDKGYLTQEQLAKKMGISQPAIANKLRLLNLDEDVQQALLNGQISERHARSLLAVNSKEDQKKWLNRIINERLTVRQLDIEIKKEADADNPSPTPIITISQDVNAIKQNAGDIPIVNNQPTGTFFNLGNMEPDSSKIPEKQSDGKVPNKFFNFLEDEAANMNPMPNINNESSIFNSVPETIPGAIPPVSEETQPNKFIDLNVPSTPSISTDISSPINDIPAPMDNLNSNINSDTSSELETLFDPMDNVELLDPEYDEKQQEKEENTLKIAINDVRNVIDELKNRGFSIEVEEIDMSNTYKITINIQK